MLKGKTIFINSGVNKAIAIRIFSAEILPASACPRKLLKRENKTNPKKTKVNEAIFTFVALDKQGQIVKVPQILPETDLEKSRYNAALRRRQLSLVLAGKMKASEATELKAIFD